jgi:hypothetical protein
MTERPSRSRGLETGYCPASAAVGYRFFSRSGRIGDLRGLPHPLSDGELRGENILQTQQSLFENLYQARCFSEGPAVVTVAELAEEGSIGS